MKKLLVSIAVVLFLGCAADAAQPKISPDRINTSQPFPSILMDEDANITLDGGFINKLQGSGMWNPVAYGAIPDDGIDDAEAIQDAMDAASNAGGGIVFFPPGQFDLNTSQSALYNSTFLEPRNNTILQGSGIGVTILRSMDDYRTPYRGNCIIADLSENFTHNWAVRDLTLDGNGQNNLIDSQSYHFADNTTKGAGIYSHKAGNITIERVEFVNISGFNALLLNGYGDTVYAHDCREAVGCVIRDCVFRNMGDDIPGNDLYDFSAIYISIKDALVENNVLYASEICRVKNMCGIEIHAPNNRAINNQIYNLSNGIYTNCDGGFAGEWVDRVLVKDNYIFGAANNAINMWGSAGKYLNSSVIGNKIIMYPLDDGTVSFGISHCADGYSSTYAYPANFVTIKDNEMEFYTSNRSASQVFGIKVCHANNTVITGNIIKNVTYEGILVHHFETTPIDVIDIRDNSILQFGTQTVDLGLQNFGIKTECYNGASVTQVISGNSIYAKSIKAANYLCGVGIYGNAQKNASAVNNNIKGVWLEVYASDAPGTYSNIHVEAYSDGAPGYGGHSIGSIYLDPTPAAGATPGWVCTTAGKPGTWKAMANLSS